MLTKIIILLIAGLLITINAAGARADTATASLSLAGASYSPGASFSVPVYEDSGSTDINVILLMLRYDSTKLQATTVEPSSILADASQPQIGSDTITITRFPNAPPFKTSGKIEVAVIDFKALNGTTNSTVSVANTSRILSGKSDLWDGVVSSATFNFASPPVNSPPPSVSSQTSKPTTTAAKPTLVQPDPLTKAWVAKKYVANTSPVEPGPFYLVRNFLIACALAAAAFVSMYFDVHVKTARRSKQLSKATGARLAHKKMLLTARRRVRRARIA